MISAEASRQPLSCSNALLFEPRVSSTCFTPRKTASNIKRQGCVSVNCSGRNVDPENGPDQIKGEKAPVDWDKAWTSIRKQRRSSFSFGFDMDKYVTRNPEHLKYPLSEEVDPFKRIENTTLGFWTDPNFTVAGVGVILGLFFYMVVIVGPPPTR